MTYKVEVIRKEDLQTNLWAGGTTTQLAIHPREALYSEGDFKWRLSTAKVEVKESVFTLLPNINRILMVIDGELVLDHEGQYKTTLKAFKQDSFSGSWKTKSYGQVTDFNLMMKAGCEGNLKSFHIEKDQSEKFFFSKKKGFKNIALAIYCSKGDIELGISNDTIMDLFEKSVVLILSQDDSENLPIEIYNVEDGKADVVVATIHY